VIKKLVLPKGGAPGTVTKRDAENLHRVGPDGDNADIVGFLRGKRIFRVPYSERLKKRLDAKIPEVEVTKRERGEKRKEILGKKKRPRALRWGDLPIKQAIVWKARQLHGVDEDDLIHWLIEDLASDERTRWFTWGDLDEIYSVINELDSDDHVFKGDGKIYPGADLDLGGESPYDIEAGPYPAIRLMRSLAERRGRTSFSRIDDRLRDKKWASSRNAVENMASRAVEWGILKEVEENTYEAGRAI